METLEILLQKLPPTSRQEFRVPDIPHNLIAAIKLADAGCGIHLYKHYGKIEYKGETLTEAGVTSQQDAVDSK